ncbi:1-deoxy-D-xylulose-5-phosphate synthase [Nonlabens dokdonensis]|jgi:1-deoxy-D-xylulose-5-phosphate synthase|uniref:1-deoxy-D-xylulose-5-phosphate synthase n=2 Tax=Nonlabens dokdonensis TaxID=328515 RepID=L7WDE7_NONDD|nr:1-deoxy-D-xylulose-5-phosphate synthase [Nonlabens dokdonensis]AGC76903.1 deoxyxylulose-5-phosphate synthase [Nonlabens dokdonensis DSW-6]PZX36811.1 1-deoxy-D-xylulose-5-phosphate synthase [Nonlabens dokdonensis]
MSETLLETIDNPDDLKRFRESELEQIAQELRAFIIEIVAAKEGHLGASLGVVELTIALHYVFNTPDDQLVWDVGHQAYGHKILTGRRDVFHTNRDLGGISGFPKRSESEYDTFGTGHSSTSISAALGMAMASALKSEDRKHIAVVGDASIASGMAFEALNHAGVSGADLLVILNDNAIGIDPSVGALKYYLTKTKSGKETGNDNIFESLNFDYSGPIDGHDLPLLLSELKRQKSLKGPRLLHVRTVKGKGLKQAEIDQVRYHAPGKFDKITGEIQASDSSKLPPKFQDVFGHTIVELAQENEKIVGITPAMPTGSSMKMMMEALPDRAFDVGIAEQHAVTLAAGMATQGLVPFCNVYSTFLQRAYDQIIHDVALQKLPVIFCLDRAGLVGKDGATHHGIFDLAYLNCIPDMIIAAPMDAVEMRNMMFTASQGLELPIAIRYPRGRGKIVNWKQPFKKLEIGSSRLLRKGEKIAVISIGPVGTMIEELLDQENLACTHLDMRFLKPIDQKAIESIFENHEHVITIEDGTTIGGLGSVICDLAAGFNKAFAKAETVKIHKLGIPDQFIEHGPTADLYKIAGIDRESVLKLIDRLL